LDLGDESEGSGKKNEETDEEHPAEAHFEKKKMKSRIVVVENSFQN
jgi:hypothetical protein